ncbi:hypothetical protein [Peterkaempfera griseoplana]|uniref:hypothetical protein n=1 Tax=Peterkaempfera griseoplana TaxID=66896 RepID=UPI0006E2D4AA|nr:hypothetical protein [Peterkaempfera griseoplana]
MTRTAPVSAQQSPGSFLTSALWNAQVKAIIDWSCGSGTNGPPRFRGYQTSTQSIADSTWAALNLDTESFDSDAGHSTSSNTSRYTVQVAGTYLIIGSAGFTASATGVRAVRLLVNGANPITGTFVKTMAAAAGNSSGLVTTALSSFSAGDYVEVQGYQTSGGALSTSAGSDVACSLCALWISS